MRFQRGKKTIVRVVPPSGYRNDTGKLIFDFSSDTEGLDACSALIANYRQILPDELNAQIAVMW